MIRRAGVLVVLGVLLAGAGPQDRRLTDPVSVVSPRNAHAAAVNVADLYNTKRIGEAAWSPDGREIAYITSASGRLNLWKMSADGTGARQIVQSNERQTEPVWGRDGKAILFAQDHGGDEMFDLYRVSSAGGPPQNLSNTAHVSETNAHISPDGASVAFDSKAESSPSADIAVMDFATLSPRLLTHESDKTRTWSVAAWSTDGSAVFAVRSNEGGDDSDVYRIDVRSSVAEDLTPHTGTALIYGSDVSPDGKTLLIASNEKGGFSNVALLDVATKVKTWVTDTQWEAQPGFFAPDGAFEYALNADGRQSLTLTRPPAMQATAIALPAGLNFEAGAPSPFSPDGTKLLVAHQDSTRPSDLWVVDVRTGKATQLTHAASASLARVPLPRSQIVHYETYDGKTISAFLWMPFNKKRDGTVPAVVYPHGGPTGQTTDFFNPVALALASRGYAVIAPNVRGSTGYGLQFQKANYQDLGGGDLRDEVYAVKFLTRTGYVNPKKIGITGGSYGGFMTLMAIGKTPSVWAAAAEEYGIIDWYTMLKNEEPSLQQYERSLLGDPDKDRSVYEATSPIKYLATETAPLLVLQGERDIRVPKEEAAQVVQILQNAGKTVEVQYYPQEGHGFMKREDQIDALTRIVNWFDRYLKGRK